LAKIGATDQWQGLGNTISLPPSSDDLASRQVESRFGIAFLDNLRGVEQLDSWSGPIVSGFGWHIVRLRARNVGQVPPLEEIRDRVENDWRTQTLEKRKDDAYQILRDAYEVSVER
jgi:hypothetical protein